MPRGTQETCNDPDKTKINTTTRENTNDMPQVHRAGVILPFCAAYDIPVKPKTIYGGLIEHQQITFSYKQARDTISELHADGFLRRVAIDTDSEPSTIRDIPADASGRRGYYLITDKGRTRAAEYSK
mgnify:CR=1 FL=1